MKLRNLLPKSLLKEGVKHKFGYIALFFTFTEMKKIHSVIDSNDIFIDDDDDDSFGLETEPHTTLLYGIHEEVSVQDVEDILNKYTYYTCEVSNPSLFESDKYDVLKFDVTGDNLHETNGDLKSLPHTSSYPKYHPHLTIGYVNPGKGKKYVDKLNKIGQNSFWLTPQYVVFSRANGKKTKIKIRID